MAKSARFRRMTWESEALQRRRRLDLRLLRPPDHPRSARDGCAPTRHAIQPDWAKLIVEVGNRSLIRSRGVRQQWRRRRQRLDE